MNDAIVRQLTAYVDGELNGAERQAVELLLRDSAEARSLLRTLECDAARLRSLARIPAPAELTERVLARIRSYRTLQIRRPAHARLAWGSVAAAAAIVVGIGLGTFALLEHMASGGRTPEFAGQPKPALPSVATAKTTKPSANTPAITARDLRSRLPSDEQVAEAADSLRDAVGSLVDGVAGLFSVGQDALTAALNRESDSEATPRDATTPNFLTSQLHPTKAFKTVEVSKLPLFLDIKDLEQAKLLARLREDPLHHIDLSCQEGSRSLERLQAACRVAGIKLLMDADVSQRLSKKLPTTYIVYLENVAPDVVTKLLQALQAQEKSAEQAKKGDALFGSILVMPLDDVGRRQLAESLGIPARTLIPSKSKDKGPASRVDPTKPIARETEKALDKLATGQGGVKPAGKEPVAVVLTALPPRNRPTLSKDVKLHLDSRAGLQSGSIGVVFVLRASRG